MDKNSNKKNTKKLIRDFLIANIFISVCSTIPCESILLIFIDVFFSAVMIFLYFFKVHKKELSTKESFYFAGFFGMAYSVLYALLASVASKKIIFGIIIFLVIILLVLIMELVTYLMYKKGVKMIKSAVGVTVGGSAGVFGFMLSRFFRENGWEIPYEYIIACLAVLYSVFYTSIIKSRQMKKQEKTGDGSKPLKK